MTKESDYKQFLNTVSKGVFGKTLAKLTKHSYPFSFALKIANALSCLIFLHIV